MAASDRTADGSFLRASALVAALLLPLSAPSAQAQDAGAFSLDNLGDFAGLIWIAVTAGMGFAALIAVTLLMQSRRDHRLADAEAEVENLRLALDRTEALLEADDQRTIAWASAATPPQVFGGLPERVGAPADRFQFLDLHKWLNGDHAREAEEAIDRLRRHGETFQIAVRTKTDALLELYGRTSGKRALVRFRELTGERRSFAELKEQALFVANEIAALRQLADALVFPCWRRSRTGRLTWVNAAYVRAVEAASAGAVLTSGVELLPSRTRDAIRETQKAGRAFADTATAIVAGQRTQLHVYDLPVADGGVGWAMDVSEAETLRAELASAQRSTARILDQVNAAIAIFDKAGRLQFHNSAYTSLWQLAPDFLATAPDESAILDMLRADRKLPEQANYREWRTNHLAAAEAAEIREDWWHLPDGRSLRVVALPDPETGIAYVYENVTEQLALQSRLTGLLKLQGETLSHLSEAVAVFGGNGRLRLFNPVFTEMWRLSPDLLRAEPHINELIEICGFMYPDEDMWDGIRDAITDLDNDKTISGRMDRSDRSVIDYASVALPEGMTMLTFVDVTDSARVQRVLQERNEALEAADRLKSDFIHHVSYELRSPLTNIIGQAEMVAQETFGALNDKQREYVGDIIASSESLRAIINDILDLATVDAGIMTLDIGETDVAAVARSAVEGLTDRLADQRLEVEFAIAPNVGTFHVDEARVRQILFNLVANAIRFSNAGGTIRIEALRRDDWIVYRVEDDGIGIPPDVLPSVFKPFEGRGSAERRRGPGLGLSIVKSLVELHGGSVDIRSAEGEGTVVTVLLPIVPPAAAAAAE